MASLKPQVEVASVNKAVNDSTQKHQTQEAEVVNNQVNAHEADVLEKESDEIEVPKVVVKTKVKVQKRQRT